MPVPTPSEIRTFVSAVGALLASRDLVQTLINQNNQSQENSAIQNWTIACQNFTGIVAGMATEGFGSSALALLGSGAVATGFSAFSVGMCTNASQTFVNQFNSANASLVNELSSAAAPFLTTQAQSNQFLNLLNSSSSGDLYASSTAANQLLTGTNYNININPDGSITYQNDPSFSFTLGSNGQFGAMAAYPDGSGSILSNGSTINYAPGNVPGVSIDSSATVNITFGQTASWLANAGQTPYDIQGAAGAKIDTSGDMTITGAPVNG